MKASTISFKSTTVYNNLDKEQKNIEADDIKFLTQKADEYKNEKLNINPDYLRQSHTLSTDTIEISFANQPIIDTKRFYLLDKLSNETRVFSKDDYSSGDYQKAYKNFTKVLQEKFTKLFKEL